MQAYFFYKTIVFLSAGKQVLCKAESANNVTNTFMHTIHKFLYGMRSDICMLLVCVRVLEMTADFTYIDPFLY